MSFQKRISVGSVVIILAIGSFFSYKHGLKKGKTELGTLQEQVGTHLAENIRLQQELKLTQQNYQIQVEAKKNLANHLKSLQEHNTELTQNMNLYQTVAGKPDIAVVEMKTFQVYPTPDPQTFRYSIVLSKTENAHAMVQGAVTMVIVGNIGEKVIFLPVKYENSGREDGLGFQFHHLQELSGELTLPPEFVAKEVLVKANFDQDLAAFEQAFPWVVTG